MKKILALLAVAAIAAPAYAGCGKKVASVGTLSAYDAATKTLTMKVMRTNAVSYTHLTLPTKA